MDKKSKVFVTGAAGNLGSYLVKQLLEKGYIVHASTRNLSDENKVGILKGLPHAETRLKLFEADIYSNPDGFKRAIQGCETVVHMATPLQHDPRTSLFKDTSEAAVAGVKNIVESCIEAGTVKRLVYTASVVAASPMKQDGTGFKHSIDESCWTPINLSFLYSNDSLQGYTMSKTLSEQQVLRDNGEMEVVSLVCGLVGGDTLLSTIPDSTRVLISQAKNNDQMYPTLRYLEELIGKVPIVHVQDVCQAHIFCIEQSSITGRFLCATAYLSSAEIANYCQTYYPEFVIPERFVENLGREIVWGSTKLEEHGFEYKHGAKKILEDSLKCAQKMGQF